MNPSPSPYWTRRRFWWLRPAILGPVIGLVLLAVPMAWWISTYGDMVAVGMFVFTYLLMMVFVVIMLRRSLLDTDQKLNTRAVRTARSAVEEEHLRHLRVNISKDLAAIKEGRATPVLDVWRLDRRLLDRHLFFGSIKASVLDPAARELHLRVHLSDPAMGSSLASHPRELLRDAADFLHVIARDPYLKMLRPHVDALVLEIYRMVDDGSFTGSPVAVFSLHARLPELDRYTAAAGSAPLPGNVRFADGAVVTPHRNIVIRESPGSK